MFAGGGSWFGTNFSLRAVLTLGHYRGFVLWAFLAGGYFYVLLTGLALTVCAPWLRRCVHALAIAACVMLGYAVLIPYLPEEIPGWAKLHVVLAAAACVVVMAALLLLLLHFRFWRLLWLWCAAALCCVTLFAAAGRVTSALEVFFCIAVSCLLRQLWIQRTKDDP